MPGIYLNYANFAVIPLLKDFIQGFFSRHMPAIVTTIVFCQLLIGIAMLFKAKFSDWAVLAALFFFMQYNATGHWCCFSGHINNGCRHVPVIGQVSLSKLFVAQAKESTYHHFLNK
jgi:hypothetical protein